VTLHERSPRGSELPRGAGRFGRRSALGLLGLLVGAVPFLLLLLLVQQQWALLRAADDGLADGLNGPVAAHPDVVRALEALTQLGGALAAVYVLSLTAAFLWIRGRRRLTAYVVTTGMGLVVLVPLTKVLVGRQRPQVDVPVTDVPVTDSFPSGHAMTSFVTWVVVALVVSPSVRSRLRPWLLALAVLLSVAIGLTRLALGVHYLSDVLAGWALGAGWLAVTTVLFRAWRIEQGRVSPSVGQGLEQHGTPLAPVRDRLLPDGWRTLLRLAGTALALAALTAGVSASGALASGRALPLGPVPAALSEPGSLLATTVAASVLVLAVVRRRGPALLPPLAVLGAVVVVRVASLLVPAEEPAWRAAAAAAAYGCLAVLLVFRGASPLRWSVLVPPAVLAVLSAGSRQDAGWPAVLVGAAVGTAWLAACTRWQLLPGAAPTPYPEGRRNPGEAVGARR